MESRSSQPTNVIRFPGARSAANPRRDQKSLMDSVYSAGSLTIGADDRMTKAMATRLTIFGFVVIDEIQADGMRSASSSLRGLSCLDGLALARLEAFGILPHR